MSSTFPQIAVVHIGVTQVLETPCFNIRIVLFKVATGAGFL